MDGTTRWLLYAGAALGVTLLLRSIAQTQHAKAEKDLERVRVALGLKPRSPRIRVGSASRATDSIESDKTSSE